MNSYFLALCILATILGNLGDLYGRRRWFYIGSGIFAIASIIAGASPTIHWLIIGRFLQGIGAALVFPLGPSLLPLTFPENERAKTIAWLGSTGGIALALGPVLGGLILTYWGWRWIFFINIPIIILGYLVCFKFLEESYSDKKNIKLDWIGMILVSFTLGGLVLGLINSQTYGWANIFTINCIVLSIISGAFLIKYERKQKNPLIDFRDFSNVLFYGGAVLCFLAGALSGVALFFDPLYLEIIRNQSPQSSGLILFAIPIALFAFAFTINFFIRRLGILNTILLGILLACLAMTLQIFFSNTTSFWFVVIAFICLGCFWAMGNTVPIIAAQTASGPDRLSIATATMVTMFNVGGSIGLALAIVIYHSITALNLRKLMQLSPNINIEGFRLLENMIKNPAQSLQIKIDRNIHHIFSDLFIKGFTSVMWFLMLMSIIFLFSLIIFRIKKSSE